MACLAEFLDRLLTHGTAVLRARPDLQPRDRREAAARLEAAHADVRLDVAGPPVPFDGPAALAAAELVWRACWFLLQRGEQEQEAGMFLQVPRAPRTAAEHLSADLTLRFLPQIHRRARSINADDVLTQRLTEALRQAPLSGVLADLEEGPSVPIELDGHPGLHLLYAERLAGKVRPAWVPEQGPARAYVELVFAERGLSVPPAAAATCPEGDS
jgi:hypothetical protein